jgi:hypothetical protein
MQPKALYVHCINQSLGLAFQDAVSAIPQCREALNQIKDLVNFVRESPKRCLGSMNFKLLIQHTFATLPNMMDDENFQHTVCSKKLY